MLRANEQIVRVINTKVGNHSVSTNYVHGCTVKDYIYHSTPICTVNEDRMTFSTDNGGWNTSSTTRAINDYRRYFKSHGYKDLNESED